MMKMMSISCLRNVLTNMRHLTGFGAKPGTRLWERLILPFVKGITTGLAETCGNVAVVGGLAPVSSVIDWCRHTSVRDASLGTFIDSHW